ncbi:MAG: hypothetical protein LBN32_00915 [Helicobacteraceae bacterium]|jgi:hypothetical protein|nr:hypothetical protein [Helicobacteraceae bacterium]
MRILCFLLFVAWAEAAVFETYYSADKPPKTVQPPAQTSPSKTVQPIVQTPARVIETKPIAPPKSNPSGQNIVPTFRQPARSPTTPIVRFSTKERAPHGAFALGGNYLVKVSTGLSALRREVSVETSNSMERVICTPTGKTIGEANGDTLECSENDARFRWQIGIGYQLANEGNFWALEYGAADSETKELLFSFAYTMPSLKTWNTIPFIKLGAIAGFGDSEKYSPSSLGFLAEIGGYNYLNDSNSVRLEYGLNFSRSQWLRIEHSYGKEYWTDNRWYLYLGATYRF